MADKVDRLLGGSLGSFWPIHAGVTPDLDDSKSSPGFLHELDGDIELVLLRDDPMPNPTPKRVPVGFIGTTEHGGVLVRDVFSVTRSFSFGTSKAAVDRYSAETAITEPQIDSLDSVDLASASGSFGGDGPIEWAGMDAISRTVSTNSLGRVQSARVDMKSVPDLVASIGDFSRLRLTAHWHLNEKPGSGHAVDTALRVSVETSRPSRKRNLIVPLLSVQDLLGLAFGGRYGVTEGTGTPVGSQQAGEMWTSQLMGTPPGVSGADREAFPIWSLDDIGGADGLARWVTLSRTHPRAVGPIVRRLRAGVTSAEVQTLELGAAIEYWFNVNKVLKRSWVQPKVKGKGGNGFYAKALARHVGPSFTDWVGDPLTWAELFWKNYNGLKHDPAFSYSHRDLSLCAEGAHRLLVAALLNRVAPSKRPARALFGDHRNKRLGDYLTGLTR